MSDALTFEGWWQEFKALAEKAGRHFYAGLKIKYKLIKYEEYFI